MGTDEIQLAGTLFQLNTMSNVHVKYLLIGGGVASSSAAAAIRQRDPDGSITLIGQEINRPYHRPPLSKAFLRRQMPREALFTMESGWFEAHHVALRTGRRVARLDATRSAVALDNGEEISFDRLLIATGGNPLTLDVPGAELPNLFYVRTLADIATLETTIDKARRDGRPHAGGRGRATIVGAGLLGVELAASLTQMGIAVDLLASHDHPWSNVAGSAAGRFLARVLEAHGVTVYPNARPLRLEGDGRVQRVIIPPADGRPTTGKPANGPRSGNGTRPSISPPGAIALDCDFTIAAVGSASNKDLLRNTPLASGKAILVNERCQTNLPGIYAAGDCCAVLDPLFGKHRVIDHWDHAVVTGSLAGRNMSGADEAYAAVSTFSSEVFDLTLRAWGEPRFVDRRVTFGSAAPEAPALVELGIAADGRLAQALCVGRPADEGTLRELIARRARLDGREALLRDPQFSLSSLLD